ncbi:hypothetical protein GCM10023208_05880 [Erythrobacter westpacificensis]|uniref:Lipoprotein n=1 Tax=Erythrobacter westpacificensis TaxID=1055231 RepID=A0ABP9K057_9SPHN
MDRLKTAAIAACACLAACAPVEEPAADGYDAALANLDTSRACFFTREINGYSDAPSSSARNDRLYISTGVNERWLLETYGSCPDLDFANAVGLDVRGSISVCTGQTETLLVPSTIPGEVDRCPVRVLGRVIEDD